MSNIDGQFQSLLERHEALLESQTELQKLVAQLLQDKAEGRPRRRETSPSPRQFNAGSPAPANRRDSNVSKKPSVFSRRTGQSTLQDGRRNVISVYSDDSSQSDEGESFFAEDPLPKEEYQDESYVNHIESHRWNQECRRILKPLLDLNSIKTIDDLWQADSSSEGAHGSQADIFEVGADGSPLHRTHNVSTDKQIWEVLRSINVDISRKQAVGRITIVREPHAQLFGALHFTMSKHFDMDSIYRILANESSTRAFIQGHRHSDERRQRSIIFSFKYHTLVGEKRKPLEWQKHEEDTDDRPGHVPISTCSSVVALSLGGPPANRLKRRHRRLGSEVTSHVFDSFAPWHVLSIQCFPDWYSEEHQHETHHHYVNGPDALLATLLQEYKDAAKRFRRMAKRIAELATPPREVIFNHAMRDEMLFEEGDFIWTRRYFWASQTLNVIIRDIDEMIAMYKETFTEQVWSGEHKTLFPGTSETSARFSNFRKKMLGHKKKFETEIAHLKDVRVLCVSEQRDVKGLREWLFSGTSVHESREAVSQARVTVQQGVNIQLLTLVTAFYLPLTFSTSIFGMTNMPQHDNFNNFAYVTIGVCLPTYFIIALINWDSVRRNITKMRYWAEWFWNRSCKRTTTKDFESWLREKPDVPQLSRTSTITIALGPQLSREMSNPPIMRQSSIPPRGSASFSNPLNRVQFPTRTSTIHWDLPRYKPRAEVEKAEASPNTSAPKLEPMEVVEPSPIGRTERKPRSFSVPLSVMRRSSGGQSVGTAAPV